MVSRSAIGMITLGVLVAACTSGSLTSPAMTQQQSGGCGSTPGQTGVRIPWMVGPQDVNTPHVLASPTTAAAILAGYPLRAGHPQNPTNKVAWAVRIPRNGTPLLIDAHPLGATDPVVHFEEPAASVVGDGEVYTSTIDLPAAGCWALTLRWGSPTQQTSVDLEISPSTSH